MNYYINHNIDMYSNNTVVLTKCLVLITSVYYKYRCLELIIIILYVIN